MVHVPVKAHVMAQQGRVFASKVLKDHLAFARVIVSYCFKIIWIHLVQYYLYFLLDVSCPGVGSPCSGNGQCDLTVGVCTCQEGFQGSDCFGKINLD